MNILFHKMLQNIKFLTPPIDGADWCKGIWSALVWFNRSVDFIMKLILRCSVAVVSIQIMAG